jgi:lipooligosaccharide transport system ATP-binding protein
MDGGKILVEGSPGELISRYVGSDVVEADNTPEAVSCLEELREKFDIHGDMVQVFTDRPREVAKRLFETCNPGRVMVRRGSLEDVFLKLTGRVLRD